MVGTSNWLASIVHFCKATHKMLKQIFYHVVHLPGVTGDAWEITKSQKKNRENEREREKEGGDLCYPRMFASKRDVFTRETISSEFSDNLDDNL